MEQMCYISLQPLVKAEKPFSLTLNCVGTKATAPSGGYIWNCGEVRFKIFVTE